MLKLQTFAQQRNYLLKQPQFQGQAFSPSVLDVIHSEVDFETVRKVENTIAELDAEIKLLGDSATSAMFNRKQAYVERLNSIYQTVEAVLKREANRATETAQKRQNNTQDVAEFKKDLEAFLKPFWEKAGKTSNMAMVELIRPMRESAGIR